MKISPSSGLTALAALALALTAACAPTDSDGGSDGGSGADAAKAATSLSECKPADLPLLTSGTFTIATDDPAFEPWFVDNDPTNGQGFEGAVAYAVADRLGFAKDDVTWVKAGFNQAVQAGTKTFDVDINQFSITDDRAKVVDFSSPYYSAAQAIITLEDSSFAGATSLADLKDAKLGAQVATTSLEAIKQIDPATDPLVYDDTTKAAQALQNGQVDAVVADLPSAYYLTAAELDGATIVGQFQPTTGESEQFGLLLAKDSALTPCVSLAVDALVDDGTLAALEKEWLTQATDVPELK
jgi:polar amino acid transport system substrate-binding protein